MIFACDLNGGIGLDGDLPWNFKDYPIDMKFFKETSLKYQNLISGRVNFDSMGPLKDRVIYKLSSSTQESIFDKCVTVSMDVLNELIKRQDFLVVGGAATYKMFEDKATKVYRTTIKKELDFDVSYVLPKEFKVEEVVYEDENLIIEVLTRC